MRYAVGRQPVPGQVKHKLGHKTFPAPTRGWVVNENLATQRGASALVLENWFPTSTGIRVRGGASKYATVGSSEPVVSMWSYNQSGNSKFFAATATSIFDITTVADEDTIPTADVTGQTSGYYASQQFTTAGGSYLYAVNGDDDAQLFDGTSWTAIDNASTPAITGVDTSKFSHVWAFASRLFFVESGSLNAWYLPVDSIGGAANSFSLAGIFQKGGALLFGGTWSLDSGDGLDDKCVFISTEGEVAVYEGTNPASAADWRKVGVYSITAPMGIKATMQAGGDMLVATQDGIVPLSEAIRKDVAALSLAAVTVSIEPAWKEEVIRRSPLPWEIVKWPTNNMMLVSQPVTTASDAPQMLVANLETGAWCKFTGWDTRCIALYNDFGFFGTNDGVIYQMEVGGSDDGEAYTCQYVPSFDHFGTIGFTKTVMQAKSVFRGKNDFIPALSASIDYAIDLPSPPNSPADFTADEWDSGLWDVAKWDAEYAFSISSAWQSIGRTGESFAIQVQCTFGVSAFPRLELISTHATYTQGQLVV